MFIYICQAPPCFQKLNNWNPEKVCLVICGCLLVVYGHLLVVCGHLLVVCGCSWSFVGGLCWFVVCVGLWPLLVLVTTSSNDKLQKYSCKTNTNSKNVITVSAIELWNNSQNYLKAILLKLLTPSKIKLLLSNEYLKNY